MRGKSALLLAFSVAATFTLPHTALAFSTQESPYITQLRSDAEAGKIAAQSELANVYLNGSGVTKSATEAYKWWRKAAEQGDARALSQVGTMFYQGLGVARDSNEAVRWWQKAAEKHDPDAQGQLGYAYLLGDGLPQSYTMAYMWFNLAAANGDQHSVKARDLVAKDMPAEMIADAQRLTNEWNQQHPGTNAQPAAK